MDYKEAFEEVFRFHVGVSWSFLPDKVKDRMTLEDMVEFFETESKKQTAYLLRAARQCELSAKREADRERAKAVRLNKEVESYAERLRGTKDQNLNRKNVPRFSFMHEAKKKPAVAQQLPFEIKKNNKQKKTAKESLSDAENSDPAREKALERQKPSPWIKLLDKQGKATRQASAEDVFEDPLRYAAEDESRKAEISKIAGILKRLADRKNDKIRRREPWKR